METIDICNIALGYLNHPALSSLQDDRPEAELCRRLHPVVLSRCLGCHGWSFATRTAGLRRLSEESPYDDLPGAYALPPGCIRVIEADAPYVKEGQRIYSSGGDPLQVSYVRTSDDPSDWPARFLAAVCYLLASELAMPLSGNAQLCQLLKSHHAEEMNAAISEDCAENFAAHQADRPVGRWELAHRRGQ